MSAPSGRGLTSRLSGLAPAGAIVSVQLLLYPIPAGLWLRGLIIGGLTALVALGMALTFRTSRIVNFAQAELGTVPVVLSLMLLTSSGWPYPIAVLAGLTASVLMGALVELVVVRRFFRAPRLLLTVATLGLSQLLAAIAVALPTLWGSNSLVGARVEAPFDLKFAVGDGPGAVIFRGNDVLALVITPIALIALGVWFHSSAIGVAVRASADDSDRASMLGIPVKRLQTVVWAWAGCLAFVAMFLRAGVLGVPLDAALSFAVLLRALTALVLGRMTNLVSIALSSMALGVLEVAVASNASRPGTVDAVLAVVVCLGLVILRPTRDPRVHIDDVSSWAFADEVRPIPRDLLRLRSVQITRITAGGALIAASLAAPHLLAVDQTLKASALLIYAILGLSLVVMTGWGGQISLGQVGFFALGAAVGANASVDWNLDLALCLPLAGAAGACAAAVVGVPALRQRGLYLAVTTLACSLAATSYLLNPSFAQWIPTGRVERTPLFGRVGIDSATAMYYVALAVLVVCFVGLHGVRRSRSGRALLAVRDNEKAAEAFAIHASRLRLMAFCISGAIASVAGCLIVYHQQAYDLSLFEPSDNFFLLTMVVVGGIATPSGAVLGAAYLLGCRWFLPTEWQLLASGVGVLAVLLVMPSGLGGLLFRCRDAWLRRLARRHSLVAPGFVGAPGNPHRPVPQPAAAAAGAP